MITVANCTEDELDAAMLRFLIVTLEREPDVLPLQLAYLTWGSSRQETKEAFARQFPRQMDKPKNRKGRRIKSNTTEEA